MDKNKIILSRKTQQKYVKKYKCPYCETRLPKGDLGEHIGDKHFDMIPKDETPNQVAYNTVQKKDPEDFRCVSCGKQLNWNEEKGNYGRLCGSKKCTGFVRQTHGFSDASVRDKALKNRGISGIYTFSDGSKFDYVGSYERDLLEFLDKIMQMDPRDIRTPGPKIKYNLKGKVATWTTDVFIVPYNLVIDCKDGGDNPNTKELSGDSRDRQVAKEKQIAKDGEYNYLRLTDKNNAQLLEVMLYLKKAYMDYDPTSNVVKRRVVQINESAGDDLNTKINLLKELMTQADYMPITAPRRDDPNHMYVVDIARNNVFYNPEDEDDEEEIHEYGLYTGEMSNCITFREGAFRVTQLNDIVKEAIDIHVYRYIPGGNVLDTVYQAEDDKDIYRVLTKKTLYSPSQLAFNSLFEPVDQSPIEEMFLLKSCLEASIKDTFEYSIPMLESSIELDNYKRDLDGVYFEMGGLRTPSFKSVTEVPDRYRKFVLRNYKR